MKRIFIFSQQSMFCSGIESLISQESDVVIVGRNSDVDSSLECIKEEKPDVVIVNCDENEPGLTAVMMNAIRDRLGICVIGLSLRDNQISVFRGEKKQVSQVDDLLEIFRE